MTTAHSEDTSDPRRGGFSFGRLAQEFDEEMTSEMRRLFDLQRGTVIPAENVARYSHGHHWLETVPGGGTAPAEFKEHAHEFTLQLQDIRENKITVIPEHVTSVMTEMTRQFMESMFAKVSEVTEAAGNVVDAKQFDSPALAFVEGLKRIEFGVDRDGNVSRPQLRLGQQAFDALKRDMEKHGKALEETVRQITEQKEKDALAHEKARRARFKGVG